MTESQLTYWTPFIDDSGEVIGYECKIKRDSFEVLGTWTEQDGYGAYIDHDHDAPFTVPQLKDLIATLREMMTQDDETAPIGRAVEILQQSVTTQH